MLEAVAPVVTPAHGHRREGGSRAVLASARKPPESATVVYLTVRRGPGAPSQVDERTFESVRNFDGLAVVKFYAVRTRLVRVSVALLRGCAR